MTREAQFRSLLLKNDAGSPHRSLCSGSLISCYAKVADKSSKVARLFNSVQKATVSWNRLKNYIPTNVVTFDDKQTHFDNKPVNMSINGVFCGYETGKEILKNVSFSAHSGQIIGVTGIVASGKTTMGKLLLGEVPYSGSIKIDGKELSEMTTDERSDRITYLGHKPELFSDSIRENVEMGSDVKAEEFLQIVRLSGEVEAMDKEADTSIGSFGMRLSGGQQARVALARTLAHAKNIIILDDPFSAVDKKTELEILNEMRSRFSDRLIILISHRLTVFPTLDKVLWIEDGFVTETTHEKLIESSEKYRSLFEMQRGLYGG